MAKTRRRNGTRRRQKRSPIGSSPGTLIADPSAVKSALTVTVCSAETYKVFSSVSLDDVQKLRETWPLIWVDCIGLGDADLISGLGKIFGLHPLALEDTINTGQRPKADFYDDYAFLVIDCVETNEQHHFEQVSVFFSANYVITFQEREGDSFDPVRRRLARDGENRIRSGKGDYLAYALIDTIVDTYFPLTDLLGDRIDSVETALTEEKNPEQNGEIHDVRRRLMSLKRTLWPLRDALSSMVRADMPVIGRDTKLYFNDTLDHVSSLMEIVETYRDTVNSLTEMSMSQAQARTNEVINLLTVVSTIFIPLTFLVGVWGMNFDPEISPWNMPELKFYYGYPFALGTMLVLAIGLYLYFRWRRWL